MTEAHSQRAHAKLSPSGAHRWAACPGSIRECEGLPNVSSVFADEGSAAHELCAKCLTVGHDADAYEGFYVDLKTGKITEDQPANMDRVFVVTPEMAEGAQLYLDVCREIMSANLFVEHEIEARLDMSDVPGMEFGMGDFCAYDAQDKRLTIADMKYGRGVPVEVDDNPQLLAYALGVAKRYHNRGVKEIELVVVQPRCPHTAGPVRRYTISAVELIDFQTRLSEAALATLDPNAPLNAGEWCKFCLAAHKCPALRKHSLEAAAAAFAEGDIDQPFTSTPPRAANELSPEELRDTLRKADTIKMWVSAVEAHAHHEATHGRTPLGFKLVAKRATRKWKDEKAADDFLGMMFEPDVYKPRKMLSPAKVDTLLKKDKAMIRDLYESKSSGTTLAPESDPRPAVKLDASAFGDAGEGDDS